MDLWTTDPSTEPAADGQSEALLFVPLPVPLLVLLLVSVLALLFGSLFVSLEAELPDFGKFEEAVATETAAAEARLAKLQEERKGLESEGIPEDQLTLYLGLLERREGEALAELADLICQGCFVSIPRNLYVRIMRGVELVQCPNCNRILYSHG